MKKTMLSLLFANCVVALSVGGQSNFYQQELAERAFFRRNHIRACLVYQLADDAYPARSKLLGEDHYDPQGKLTYQLRLVEPYDTAHLAYHYDNTGKIVGKTLRRTSCPKQHWEYRYDSKQRLAQSVRHHSTPEYIAYQYTENGYLQTMTYYHRQRFTPPDSTVWEQIGRRTFTYNRKGNLMLEQYFRYQEPIYEEALVYDKKGKLELSKVYENGILTVETMYCYDDRGLKTQEVRRFPYEGQTEVRYFVYLTFQK